MAELSGKSIYFDSNSFAIKPEYQDFLRQIHRFLMDNPGHTIGLIGNADERGRGQLASGQKRADAVKQALKTLGLDDLRIQAISLGDTNPRATCHDESCWVQNRRVDIVFFGSSASAAATAYGNRSN